MAVDSNEPLGVPLVDPAGDPLGATPMLPRPEGAAADRAHQMFARFVAERRVTAPTLAVPTATEPSAHAFADPETGARVEPRAGQPRWLQVPAGPRQYSRALAVVEAAVRGTAAPSADEELAVGASEPWVASSPDPLLAEATDFAEAVAEPTADALGDASVEASLPVRPPPGVPVVRPSAPVPSPSAVSELDLSQRTDAGMFIQQPDGATAFEVELEDATLGLLTCRVTVRDGRIAAAFVSPDVNTRRLLEAEAGRLRVRLEERGLRVDEVTVAAG